MLHTTPYTVSMKRQINKLLSESLLQSVCSFLDNEIHFIGSSKVNVSEGDAEIIHFQIFQIIFMVVTKNSHKYSGNSGPSHHSGALS